MAEPKNHTVVVSLVIAVLGVVGAYLAASVAAQSASTVTAQKWQQELLDDQRKSLHLAVVEYLTAMAKTMGHAQEVTSNALHRGIELSDEEHLKYDREQRQNLLALNVAGTKLFMESPEVANAFAKSHSLLAGVEDKVSVMLRDKTLDKRAARWKELNDTLLSIQFVEPLRTVQPMLIRPVIPASYPAPTK